MCSRSTCQGCARDDGCGWCNGPNAVTAGECMAQDDEASCSSGVLLLEVDECPSVGADVSLDRTCATYSPDAYTLRLEGERIQPQRFGTFFPGGGYRLR